MRFWKAVLGGLVLLGAASNLAAASACEVDRPIVLAGLNWESNAFHAAVASRILKDGFDCRVEVAPGATKPLFKSMMRGDIDIMMEVWKDNLPKLWPQALREEKVIEVGINLPDAEQGWFVPRYLVEGPAARAPGLVSVADLPEYKHVFADPQDRARGRFYNCMLGWGCEKINSAKLKAYGLTEHYTNFRSASGAALIEAIQRHYNRKEPFLTYYWGPTWVLGEFDLVMLKEPDFDPDIWQQLTRDRNPSAATAYPTSIVGVGVNAEFGQGAPKIVKFLSQYRTTNAMVSEALAEMHRTGEGAAAAAERFLRERGDLWQSWVSAEVAGKVLASLADQG